MASEHFRPLEGAEREILNALLTPSFPGREQVIHQMEHSLVRSIDENGSLEFQANVPLAAAPVITRVAAEGEIEDSDGVIVHYLLHVVAGKLQELEVFKEDNSGIVNRPMASAIRVFAPS